MNAPRLLLVMNRATARLALPTLARAAVDGGVDVVQVRERDLHAKELDELVGEVVSMVGACRVAINGSHEIAARRGVHLHLPEHSMTSFRHEACSSLSASIHSTSDLETIPAELDYVIAGHVFPTATHPGQAPMGTAGLRRIVAASRVPVVAIGGIDPGRVAEIVATRTAGIAVMSYVNSSLEPKLAARGLRDALELSMNQQTTMVEVQVNGKAMDIEPGTTLTAFLEHRNLHPRLVVVERNRDIVAKSVYDSVVLEQGDLLEIAHFVGGG